MPIPYCWGSQIISLQMGSAVLCDCQKQWTSNMAARGHIASFIYEASSPSWAGGGGGSFCYPSWGHALQPVLSIFLVSAVICFARIEIQPGLWRSHLSLAREDGSLLKLGMSEGDTGVNFHSCPIPLPPKYVCPVPVPKEWLPSCSDNAKILIWCFPILSIFFLGFFVFFCSFFYSHHLASMLPMPRTLVDLW